MDTGIGTAATLDSVQPEKTAEHQAGDGQIVIVRPMVLDNVGHVLGNLFQRIYHLVERTRETDAVNAADLESTTRRLEDFLQLVMDYVSPLSVSYQYVSAADVAQSLARQLSDTIGSPVRIDAKLPLEARLLVDAGRLARAFGLLAAQLVPNSNRDGTIEIKSIARPAGRSLQLTVMIASRFVAARSSEAEMYWAVAEKLLEIQGGGLQQGAMPSGDVQWEITLPLQS